MSNTYRKFNMENCDYYDDREQHEHHKKAKVKHMNGFNDDEPKSNPIDKEEFISFMMLQSQMMENQRDEFNKIVDSMKEMNTTLLQSQLDCLNKISEMITNFKQYTNEETNKKQKIVQTNQTEENQTNVNLIKKEKKQVNKKYLCQECQRCPDVMYELTRNLISKCHSTRFGVLRKVYTVMEHKYNLDLDELSKEYAKKLGVSVCSKGYTVANNENLFKIFKDTVNSMENN